VGVSGSDAASGPSEVARDDVRAPPDEEIDVFGMNLFGLSGINPAGTFGKLEVPR
jgi:hypothetical protein